MDQTRNNQPYFVPVQPYNYDKQYDKPYKDKYIEKFTKGTTKEYNSMYGGKEIAFKGVKEKDGKMNFFVYTANYQNNNVMEYDIIKNINLDNDFIEYDNNKIGKEVKIDKPSSIRTCITNNKNYVTSFEDNKIYVIDTSSQLKNAEKYIKLGEDKGPTYIDLYRPNDNTIYGYTSNYNDNTVSILDLNNNTKIEDIKVGKNPSFVCVAEKKKLLFVANYSDNNISCYKLDESGKATKMTEHKTGKNPTCIEINPSETHIYITNYGDSTISVFDIDEEKNINDGTPIEIPDGAKPYSIDFNTKNSTGAILTNKGVYLINTEENNNLKLVDFTDEEDKEMGEITSVRYRYYEKEGEKYEYLFIKNNQGKLFRKVITNNEHEGNEVIQQFQNYEAFYNFL